MDNPIKSECIKLESGLMFAFINETADEKPRLVIKNKKTLFVGATLNLAETFALQEFLKRCLIKS